MVPPAGRGKQQSTRTSRGGGIQKRRGTPRTDRDGDVSMDAAGKAQGHPAAAGNNATRGGRGRAPTRLSSRVAQNIATYIEHDTSSVPGRGGRGKLVPGSKSRFASTTKLKVLGLKNSKAAGNADGGERGLLDFLERKASKGDKKITINKSQVDGDYVFLNVSKEDAPEILRLNTFSYAGAPLTITETSEPWPSKAAKLSAASVSTIEQMRSALASRYNPETKVLDLSALYQDPILVEMGMFNGNQSTTEKAFLTLVRHAADQFKTREEKKDAVQAVSIANNQLDNVAQVFTLAESFPQLRRLDLSNNKLDAIAKLSRWRHRFKELEELHMLGNPIMAEVPNLVTELLQWYPRLQVFNGQQVRTAQEVEELANAKPVPIPQLPSNFRDVNGLGENFVREFFRLYDEDRTSLANTFYDDDSYFSLAVNTQKDDPNTAVLPWKSYVRFSRNLAILKDPAAKTQRLFHGAPMIAELWKKLPQTKHPSIEEGLKWIMDCHPVPQGFLTSALAPTSEVPDGLFIVVFGEFEEHEATINKTGMRSFSRGFVLGPGRTERSPIRVVSDMLLLSSHRVHTPVEPPAIPAGMTDDLKRQVIQDLSDRTGMSLQYAQMCCEGPEANWNFHLALLSFERLKAQLPPDAFLTAPAV